MTEKHKNHPMIPGLYDNPIDLVGLMMAFEDGQGTINSLMILFSHLIKTGMAWTLQGFYGRTANKLIQDGYIDTEGNINQELVDAYKHQEF